MDYVKAASADSVRGQLHALPWELFFFYVKKVIPMYRGGGRQLCVPAQELVQITPVLTFIYLFSSLY